MIFTKTANGRRRYLYRVDYVPVQLSPDGNVVRGTGRSKNISVASIDAGIRDIAELQGACHGTTRPHDKTPLVKLSQATLDKYGPDKPLLEIMTEDERAQLSEHLSALRSAEHEQDRDLVLRMPEIALRRLADALEDTDAVERLMEKRGPDALKQLAALVVPQMDRIKKSLRHHGITQSDARPAKAPKPAASRPENNHELPLEGSTGSNE